MKILTLVALVSSFTLSCGKSKSESNDKKPSVDATSLASSPASGKVGDRDWTVYAARAKRRNTGSIESFSFTLLASLTKDYYGKDRDVCDSIFGGSDERSVMFSTPARQGIFQLGGGDGESYSRMLTFYYYKNGVSHNSITDEGTIVLDEVTDTQVKGRVIAAYREEKVNGAFTAKICK